MGQEHLALKIYGQGGILLTTCTPEQVSAVYYAAYKPGDMIALELGETDRYVVVQFEDTGFYPHATSNIQATSAGFAPRTAIDGVLENAAHMMWPYQGTELLEMEKSALAQVFAIKPRTVTSLTLCELRKHEDASLYTALTQIEAWGTEAKTEG